MIPSSRRSTTTKLRFALLPVGQIGVHKALEDPTMIGCQEVDKFMDDDKLTQRLGQCQQVHVQGQPSGGRNGGPFGRHRAQMHLGRLDADTRDSWGF